MQMYIDNEDIQDIIDGTNCTAVCNSVDFGKRNINMLQLSEGAIKGSIGTAQPVFSPKTATFTIIIHGRKKNAMLAASSSILKAIQSVSTFSFDDISHRFTGSLSKYQRTETVPDRMVKLVLNVQGQEIGREVVWTQSNWTKETSYALLNRGTYFSPAKVYMVCSVTADKNGSYDCKFTGLIRDPWYMTDEDFTFRTKKLPSTSSPTGQLYTVFIDGNTGNLGFYNPIILDYNSSITGAEYAAQVKQYLKEQLAANPPTPMTELRDTILCNGLPILKPGTNQFELIDERLGTHFRVNSITITYNPVYL